MRHEAEGLKFKVPESMRKEMLALLHESHQGIENSRARAGEVMYWPGVSRDIEDTSTRCSKCAEWRRNNQKEPLIPHEVPGRPWQALGADMFEFRGKNICVLWITTSNFLKSAYFRLRRLPLSWLI